MLDRFFCMLDRHQPRARKQFYFKGEHDAHCRCCGAPLERREGGSWKAARVRRT